MPPISSFYGILLDAWLALHEDELKASWIALNENGEVLKIRGLE